MRTTLVIADDLLRRARIRAAEAGTTLSAVVEEGLARFLGEGDTPSPEPEHLAAHGAGGLRPGVDLADNRRVRDFLDEPS